MLSGRKIIVVDDSEIVRELAREMVQGAGGKVLLLDSPLGLTNTMRAERPDLVLIDIQMPALSGTEAVALLLKQQRAYRCPLILYSDRSEDELRRLTRESGASGFIRKSGDADAFVKAIAQFIERGAQ